MVEQEVRKIHEEIQKIYKNDKPKEELWNMYTTDKRLRDTVRKLKVKPKRAKRAA